MSYEKEGKENLQEQDQVNNAWFINFLKKSNLDINQLKTYNHIYHACFQI